MQEYIKFKDKLKLHLSFISSFIIGILILSIFDFFVYENLISENITSINMIIFFIFPFRIIFVTMLIYYIINLLPFDLFKNELNKEYTNKIKQIYLYTVIVILLVILHF